MLNQLTATGLGSSKCVLALAFVATATLSGIPLITNGSFENTGTATASFSINKDAVLPGWTATPSGNKILDCLVMAGATTNLCGPTAFGGGMQFWVNPGPSPDGGNFVAIDGASAYSTPLTQMVSGLVVGQSYILTFWQAAAQQKGFDGATTERWQVDFGSQSQLSTLMNNANHGSVGWMSQSMRFTAASTSQLLSFIAVGTPAGLPPFVLLDGVSMTMEAPEPATFGMIGAVLVALPLLTGMRRKKN
jgi:hypothetical protein